MANRLHLSILKQGVKEWNNWRKENPNIKPDLSRSEIFSRKPLDSDQYSSLWKGKSKLFIRDLNGINFCGCDLEGCDISSIDFGGALFNSANLRKASIKYCHFDKCSFVSASLIDVGLKKTSWLGVDFSYANLENTDFGENYQPDGVNLKYANFSYANLEGASFRCANLEGATLESANLKNASLRLAILTRASLKNAILFQTDLNGVKGLETAFLDNAIYEDVPWEPQMKSLKDAPISLSQAVYSQEEPQSAIDQAEGQMVLCQDIEFLKRTIQEISERLPLPNVKSGDLQGLAFKSKSELKIAEVLEEQGILFFPNAVLRITSVEGERKTREVDFLIFHQGAWGILEVDGPFHTPDRRVTEQEQERAFKKEGILVYERFDSLRCHKDPEEVVKTFLSVLKNFKT